MKPITINKSQIVGKRPLGVIKGMEGSEKYKNTVTSYIDGTIPILICTNLTQTQWDRACSGTLTSQDRFELAVMGLM